MKSKHPLRTLMNVGPATFEDLMLLDIHDLPTLAGTNPDELFARLQKITHQKQDPCVWDVFAAIIHEAKTGEKLPWWKFTSIRKNKSSK